MDTLPNENANGNANETDNKNYSKELVKQIPLIGTPFTALKLGDDWYLTMGKYRLTEKLKSLEEVQEDAKDSSWYRIMAIIRAVTLEVLNEQKLNDTVIRQKAEIDERQQKIWNDEELNKKRAEIHKYMEEANDDDDETKENKTTL